MRAKGRHVEHEGHLDCLEQTNGTLDAKEWVGWGRAEQLLSRKLTDMRKTW